MASAKSRSSTRRGASAPRSSFRGAPAKATATATPATTPRAKARPATRKAAAPWATARRARHAPPEPARAPAPAAPRAAGPELLGTITCPSGRLAIFDIGLAGFLPREALEPALIVVDVPAGRALGVTGTRVGRGRFAECWDHVTIELAPGEVHHTTRLGMAGVDFARLALIDHAAFDGWQHEDSLDGLADVVFWGRDAQALARAMRAPPQPEGHGWTDLPLEQAEARLLDAQRKQAENRWRLAIDFRPHSHHFHALAAARTSARGAGALEIGGSRMLLFFTSWGDGVFPVLLDHGADDAPVRIRIQLAGSVTSSPVPERVSS